MLLAVVVVTALWAAAAMAVVVWPAAQTWLAANALDALRYAIWFAFLASLLQGKSIAAGAETRRQRSTAVIVAVALLAQVALSEGYAFARIVGPQARTIEFGLRLGLAVFGLMLIEFLLRRAHPQSRWGLKPLTLGLAGVFAFDLFMYAQAMLFGQIDPDFWVARGIANTLAIPLIAISTARNTDWTIDMHMSRGVVFHSTALILSGVAVLTIAAAGYFVRYLGGDWGRALQIELLFGALLLTVLVASSGRFRARLSVFVSKHFFSYRYDYREQWLRFTRTLSAETSLQGLQVHSIKALADLVESPSGTLWLAQEGEGLRPVSRWNMAALTDAEPASGSLAQFLQRTGWVIDVNEFRGDAGRYPGLALPPWLSAMPNAWLVIPLASGAELVGFVVLTTPRAPIVVDWEVQDLLKTASRQAASYLGQIRASEALLEARKFDAFNRMSAFVVHDLKNLVAQLVLMLRNSERHHANPKFQQDMLATVEHVVGRMNRLMLQLRANSAPVESTRPVDLAAVVERITAAKTKAGAAIGLVLAPGIAAIGHEDRLEHVIGHLVQNAIDATTGRGSVEVRVASEGDFAVVDVTDTGVGMSAEFVRDRLFKPFETTKAEGMGIGVYESSQYVSALGGRILVDSTPGKGTRVRLLLPTAARTQPAAAALQDVT